MKILIKTTIIALLTLVLMPGCSYVSDAVEGAITDRASFSIDVEYNKPNLTITWDETDTGEGFAGFEIYRTKQPDDEYSDYTLVASRYVDESGADVGPGNYDNLDSGYKDSFTYTPSGLNGAYFFRVGIIHWDDEKEKDRTVDHGYVNGYPGAWDNVTNYNSKTDVDKISGFKGEVLY